MTRDDEQRLIDAFVDGETVDAARLRHVLRSETAVDYLVDVLALRDVVTGSVATTMPAAARRTPGWMVVAAALVLAAVGGFMAGARSPAAPAGTAISEEAPAPTRVIQLEPGVNWTESSGGM